MTKIAEGTLLSSELGEMEGFSYGTIIVQTAETRMNIRVTKDTVGYVPLDGSIIRIKYQGDALFRALEIETLVEEEEKQFFKEPLPSKEIVWPTACASCGREEDLTDYSYTHTVNASTGSAGYPSYNKKTLTYSLPVQGYLCQECKTKTEESNRKPQRIISVAIMLGIAIGLILPFIPGLLQFQPWLPQYLLYLPTLSIAIVYIIVVGIPGLLCNMTMDKFEKPFLKYIGIYARDLSYYSKPNYKIVLKSLEYREKFLRVNGSHHLAEGAGLSRLNFDIESLGAGICCFGVIVPMIAALIFHLIMG
ncbi:MAG: hypothetical protein ACTSV2_13980 [Candidatus Thorarchaeota archaeon]